MQVAIVTGASSGIGRGAASDDLVGIAQIEPRDRAYMDQPLYPGRNGAFGDQQAAIDHRTLDLVPIRAAAAMGEIDDILSPGQCALDILAVGDAAAHDLDER